MRQDPRAVWWTAVTVVCLSVPARADLHFAQPGIDAGTARTGASLTGRFPFVNRGPEVVEIVTVRTSCGCLTPRLGQGRYQPGEEGLLLLEVQTLSQPAGPQTWRAHVRYRSGGREEERTVQLTAHLVTEVQVRPAALVLIAEQALTHDLVVTDLRARPLTVTGVRASAPWLRLQRGDPERDEAGHRAWRITVTVAGDFPEGRHDEMLVLDTDDADYRELRVPVTVVRRPAQAVTATPAGVTLTAPAGQPLPSRLVLLRDRDDRRVVVDGVTADDPALGCQWAPGPDNRVTLRIRVASDRLRGGRLQSAVHVQVSQPVRQMVTIPVICTTFGNGPEPALGGSARGAYPR